MIDTPAVVVDWAQVQANLAEAASVCAREGVALRPHAKTHKSGMLAHEQISHGATGVTVAKVAEAEYFVDEGIDDVFVAYPTIGRPKVDRLVALARRARIIAGVESDVGVRHLAHAASDAGVVVEVRIEIECGLRRTGVLPSDVLRLAEMIAESPHLRLEGIFTFRSTNFPEAYGRPAAELGAEEGQLLVAAAELLRSHGHVVESVSAGSTPTYAAVASVDGVTEVRPGTYVFHDAMTVEDGVASLESVALRVRTTVIATPSSGLVVVDAGSKTLAGDVGRTRLGTVGYGVVIGGGTVVRLNEEHGMVKLPDERSVRVGDQLDIVPMHVCTVVNLSDYMHVTHPHKPPIQVGGRGLRT